MVDFIEDNDGHLMRHVDAPGAGSILHPGEIGLLIRGERAITSELELIRARRKGPRPDTTERFVMSTDSK